MGKIVETRKRYKETLDEITKSEENWLSFLDTSSWNFKYDFADQVLIYTQRPDAKAVASMEVWNKKVKRWVNKDANFIFVFSKDENSQFPFNLVFDVSDTHNSRGTEYKLWNIKPEYEKEVVEMLESNFGAETKEKTLKQAITVNSYNMVVDNIEDYMTSIQKYKTGSSLENLSDSEIYSILVPTVWASVSYMMMTRCGIDARNEIDIQEFSYIKNFNSDKIINIIGTATSDIAEMGLREIAKTVINLQKEERNINHTFVKNQKQEYSNNKEISKGGMENGENRIHESGRLQYAKSSNGNGENTNWQIRKNETSLPKGKQERRIYNSIDGQKIERTFDTYTRNSNTDVTTDNREISKTRRDNRGIEISRPDEMDSSNEQLQIDSRGANNERLDLQLEEQINQINNIDDIQTENEQIQTIAEVENTSVFLVTQEMIDEDLQLGSGFENGKFRIYQQFMKGLSDKENADFLKEEYGIGGRHTSVDNIFQNHDSKGITFEDSKSNKKYTLAWNKVAKRIGELIAQDKYLNENEKDEYMDWLDLNEIETNNTKEILENPDYELAKNLLSFIKDYDFFSYINNAPLDNTEEQNIELIIADINDENNVREYITFLKSTLEDLDYDDELAVQVRDFIIKLENKLPEYEFSNGDIIYLGIDQYEIRIIDDKKVTLIDTSFPLLTKELSIEEFKKRVKESPLNDKFRKDTKSSNDNLSQEEKEQTTIVEETNEMPHIENTLEGRLYEFVNQYDIYDIDEVSLDEIKDILNDKQKISDTVNYFYEILNAEDTTNEFTEKMKELINELTNLYEEKDKSNIEETKEDKIKINIKKKRRNKIEYFDLHPEIALNDRNNYTITNNNLGEGTPKEKFRRNIEAIKTLKKCTEENRYATPEEQEILAEYVGWGGLADVFDPNKDSWSNEYKELKDLLSEKEYTEARASSVTAFYTPPIVINSIYKALENMGLERGNILEPSCRSW